MFASYSSNTMGQEEPVSTFSSHPFNIRVTLCKSICRTYSLYESIWIAWRSTYFSHSCLFYVNSSSSNQQYKACFRNEHVITSEAGKPTEVLSTQRRRSTSSSWIGTIRASSRCARITNYYCLVVQRLMRSAVMLNIILFYRKRRNDLGIKIRQEIVFLTS